jgi:hypothetical protein
VTTGRKQRLERAVGPTLPEGMGWRSTLAAMLVALDAGRAGGP